MQPDLTLYLVFGLSFPLSAEAVNASWAKLCDTNNDGVDRST